MYNEAKLYFIFDMLGDMERSGPKLWHVKRERLEDIKDHIFDLIVLDKILSNYFPVDINNERIIDLALVHDLEEAITGDITEFEGVPKEEKMRVNNIAIEYLSTVFKDIMPFAKLYDEFENVTTIESKICHMLDKVQSIIPFAKYDYESLIDMDDPRINSILRKLPLIVEGKKQGKSLSQLFYDYHIKSVNITDDELVKFNISRAEANSICQVIKSFMDSIMEHSKHINDIKNDFPKEASIYKHV